MWAILKLGSPLAILSSLLLPAAAWAFGADMHATLNAHAHTRMQHRASEVIDRGLFLWASHAPDVWYMKDWALLATACGATCGDAHGSIADEAFNRARPERVFGYTRHLLAGARTLADVTFALGYGSHQVADHRGHLEYVIPGYRNPGDGNLIDRHTFADAVGGVLTFNRHGLLGYPTKFLLDRTFYGYDGFLPAAASTPDADALAKPSAAVGAGPRAAKRGMVIELEGGDPAPDGGHFDQTLHWRWTLDATATGLSGADVARLTDAAALGGASEGILASQYGVRSWGDGDRPFPVVVRDGAVALACGTDYASRVEHATKGFGYPLACQASLGMKVASFGTFTTFLRPSDAVDGHVHVDDGEVAEWLGKMAGDYTQNGVRLDDAALFHVDGDDLSTARALASFATLEGENYTYGRTLGEIVEGVLERTVTDVQTLVLDNPHVLGTVLQSALPPLDKARFVALGEQGRVRPRMAAWPVQLAWQEAQAALHGAPGPFAVLQLPVDVRHPHDNPAPAMVHQAYVATLELGTGQMHGAGRLVGELGYQDATGAWVDVTSLFTLDLPSGALDAAPGLVKQVGGGSPPQLELRPQAGPDTIADPSAGGETTKLRLLLDNRAAAMCFDDPAAPPSALVLQLRLEVTDPAQPPFDLLVDATLDPWVEPPATTGAQPIAEDATDNGADAPEPLEDTALALPDPQATTTLQRCAAPAGPTSSGCACHLTPLHPHPHPHHPATPPSGPNQPSPNRSSLWLIAAALAFLAWRGHRWVKEDRRPR